MKKTSRSLCRECSEKSKVVHRNNDGIFLYCPHNKVLFCEELEDGEETGQWSSIYPVEMKQGQMDFYDKAWREQHRGDTTQSYGKTQICGKGQIAIEKKFRERTALRVTGCALLRSPA